jgi:hypothetical protein
MNATVITILLSLLIPTMAWIAIVFLERKRHDTGEGDDLHPVGQNPGPIAVRVVPKPERPGGTTNGQLRDDGISILTHMRDSEHRFYRTGSGGW